MSNVITLAVRPQKSAPSARYEEIAEYSRAGMLTVALVRRASDTAALIHVALMGSAIGVEIIATLPDDEKVRAGADFVGPAALRAVELSETEFAAAACPGASA